MVKQQYNPLIDNPTEWFKRMVAAGAQEEFSDFFVITPALAAVILEHNQDNRRIVKNELKRCIDAFESGRFVTNGESIIIADDGYLNDGQHRLMACVETGKPFRTNLVFGVPRETRFTIDTGAGKTSATLMSMSGVPCASAATAAIGCYLLYEHNIYHYSATGLVTAQDLLDFYTANSTEVDTAVRITGVRTGKRMGQSALAAAYMILSRVSPKHVDNFFDMLLVGANLPARSPVLSLRNKLMATSIAHMRNHIRLEVTLRSWNAHRLGESRVQVRSFDAYPERLEC